GRRLDHRLAAAVLLVAGGNEREARGQAEGEQARTGHGPYSGGTRPVCFGVVGIVASGRGRHQRPAGRSVTSGRPCAHPSFTPDSTSSPATPSVPCAGC